MKFEFIKPDKLLLKPENELEIYELGRIMNKTELPHTIRMAGELGKPEAREIEDIGISVKDLWSWLGCQSRKDKAGKLKNS